MSTNTYSKLQPAEKAFVSTLTIRDLGNLCFLLSIAAMVAFFLLSKNSYSISKLLLFVLGCVFVQVLLVFTLWRIIRAVEEWQYKRAGKCYCPECHHEHDRSPSVHIFCRNEKRFRDETDNTQQAHVCAARDSRFPLHSDHLVRKFHWVLWHFVQDKKQAKDHSLELVAHIQSQKS